MGRFEDILGVYGSPAGSTTRDGIGVAHEELRLDNQLCFPLYACSHALTRAYKPLLDPHGLTYTQYLTMMALWEQDGISVRELGARLYLDSGTLTPLLRKLESKGLLVRGRDDTDERRRTITLTEAGRALENAMVDVPRCMAASLPLSPTESKELYHLLRKMMLRMGT